ncbi:MAG TPA: hypothetical protein VFC61_09930 [Blastocatellia bacterium]|nr:hypothetical protein [Blastocatellia bacterium]
MLYRLSLAAALLLCAAPARAQSPDKILKQSLKALGGEKALGRIKSWQGRGGITRASDGAGGRFEAAAMRPDLYTYLVEIRGFEASEGYSGKSGWRRDSRSGLRTLTGAESADFQAEAFYRNNRWLNYGKEKSRLAAAGQEAVAGRPTQVVVLTTRRNVKIKLWVDLASHLIVREELPAGAGTKVYEYADYRAVGGVMEPFAVTIAEGGERFEVRLEEVVHNPPLDRARFDFPRRSGEPLPDIPALLREVGDHQREIEQLLEKYTYTQVITSREFDKSGALKEKESETFETTFYHGRPLRRQVARNDQPLAPEDQAKEDRRIEKLIRDIEKREAEGESQGRNDKAGPPERDRRPATIADVLRASRLVNPRRERFRNRDVIVFDFEPLPGYKPQKDIEKIMGKTSGAIWVDVGDRQVVRVEARLVDSFKVGAGLLGAIKPGAAFVLEQDRINNEIWLPTYAEFNLAARALFIGLNFNATIKYGNYQRFNVETEKERLIKP